MKQIIRLTESDLHRLVKESVRRILAETDASSTGDVNNRPVFPMVRRAPILGDKTKKVDTGIDPEPAISRDGGSNHSLAVNYANESIIREAVEESVGNWLKTAALGGMMAFSPMNANAQSQDYQQQGDTISMTKKNKDIFIHKHRSPEELMKLYPQVYADRNKTPQEWITNARKGKYDLVNPEGKFLFSIRSAATKGLNPWDELVNNFRGEDFEINTKDIEPPKMDEFTRSDSIDVLKGNGSPKNNSVNGAIVSFFRNNRNITPKQTRNIRTISVDDLMFNTEKANLPSDIKNYKLVKIFGGPFLLMPINYTLQDVQAEMGLNESLERRMNEVVEEGNFFRNAALAALMAIPSSNANAQSQDYQQQPVQQTQQVQQNKPVHQRGTYWDLADDAAPVQKVTKQDIAPIMNNIHAVTANLTDYLEFIGKSLSKLNPEQRREVQKAILTHCVKNQKTRKLVNANSFSLDDASYVKRVYDTGDNLVSININGTNYFISVAALNEAMQIMGIQKGSDNLINAFKYHR